MTCDGTGRLQGGIGAVPGFKWWPIKVSVRAHSTGGCSRQQPHVLVLTIPAAFTAQAFRPCPALIESGGTYTKCVVARPRLCWLPLPRFADKALPPCRKGQDIDEVLFGKNR